MLKSLERVYCRFLRVICDYTDDVNRSLFSPSTILASSKLPDANMKNFVSLRLSERLRVSSLKISSFVVAVRLSWLFSNMATASKSWNPEYFATPDRTIISTKGLIAETSTGHSEILYSREFLSSSGGNAACPEAGKDKCKSGHCSSR